MSKITYQQYELAFSLRVHSLALKNKLYQLWLNEIDFNRKQKILRVFLKSNDRYTRRAVSFSNSLDLITIQEQQNTGDSVRHSASASVAVERDGSIGQGGNQTPKQQCKNHSVNELFCCCDDCTTSFIPPLYSVYHYELVL